eukprot:CAMPEP_0118952584 /NCGR_PEP_ID=MMETSP1169-20130426/55129_1 /TAXON_ID=36882 /ORGANISM="Pyramimonas obovata, Strain CCMP722" /LENGTH=51 /DNA_ID=CAMNT_0006899879 /DNA_START=232 /DNA_END=383 /DNA_ORIENTATION=+
MHLHAQPRVPRDDIELRLEVAVHGAVAVVGRADGGGCRGGLPGGGVPHALR